MKIVGRYFGIPIVEASFAPRNCIALSALTPGGPGEHVIYKPQTQETNPMSTTRYAKKKTRDLSPGDIFIVEDPSRNITWTPARWRVLEFSSPRLSHDEGTVPVMREDVEENRVSWHCADAPVYVEAEDQRSGDDRRQEDTGRWKEMHIQDIPVGARYSYAPRGNGITRDASAPRPHEDHTLFVRMPDRRDGRERRSGD